jgi:hypothetical protein
MKAKITLVIFVLGFKLQAQTITYSNFSNTLTNGFNAVIADAASFNLSLLTITGNGVTWDASGITQQAGTPTISFIYGNPTTTPYASLFPNSNYVFYDPALTALVSYEYVNFSTDSLVIVGQYQPSTAHEIYTNPDKRLIFPFTYNQTTIDTYAKTNYSDANTISSYQTGTRTITYAGYGTVILPQATFTNVALISELRTNSLGPDAYTYTWYEVSTGKQILYYNENNGNVTTAFTTDLNTAGIDNNSNQNIQFYPNPATEVLFMKNQNKQSQISMFNAQGQAIECAIVNGNIDISNLSKGLYFIEFIDNNNHVNSFKFIKQ